ncbi:MAG: hypothetical protein J5850_05535 [Clostridia bacterium]|nr:hypothetical protein [Clostridia bacterium]
MKTYSRVFLGIILLLAAAALICLSFFPQINLFMDIPVWKIILCVLLVYLIVAQFVNKSAIRDKFLIFVKLACIFILLKPHIFEAAGIDVSKVNNWIVILAAVLIDLAIIMIFKKNYSGSSNNNRGDFGSGISSGSNGGSERYESKFSSRVYNLDATKSKHYVMSVFGNMDVYFKNTEIDVPGEEITLTVENKFGNTDITVPSTWNVVCNVQYTFGDVENKCTEPKFPGKTITINGYSKFGHVCVHR